MADNSLRITRTIIRNAVRHVLREQIMNSMFPQETSVVDSFEESEVVQPEDGESVVIPFTITIQRNSSGDYERDYADNLISAEINQPYTDPKYPGCVVTLDSVSEPDYQSDARLYGDQVDGWDTVEYHDTHGTLTMTSECFQDWATNGWGNEDPDAVRLQALALNPDILPVMRETVEEIMFPHTALNDPDTTVEVVFTGEYVPQDSVI